MRLHHGKPIAGDDAEWPCSDRYHKERFTKFAYCDRASKGEKQKLREAGEEAPDWEMDPDVVALQEEIKSNKKKKHEGERTRFEVNDEFKKKKRKTGGNQPDV